MSTKVTNPRMAPPDVFGTAAKSTRTRVAQGLVAPLKAWLSDKARASQTATVPGKFTQNTNDSQATLPPSEAPLTQHGNGSEDTLVDTPTSPPGLDSEPVDLCDVTQAGTEVTQQTFVARTSQAKRQLPEQEAKYTYTSLAKQGEIVEADVQSRPNSPSSSQAPDLVSGATPVVRLDDGTIDGANLRSLVESLKTSLPAVPQRTQAERMQLVGLLERIGCLGENDRLEEAAKGIQLRDAFAEAAKLAASVSRNSRRPAGEHARPGDDVNAPRFYREFGHLMSQLKREHLKTATPQLMNEYLDKEMKNLEERAPGVANMMPGSFVQEATGIGLGGSIKQLFNLDGSAEYSRLQMIDDTGLTDSFRTDGGSFSTSIGAQFGKWAARYGLTLGGAYSGKDKLVETATPRQAAFAEARWDINQYAWLGRSAGPTARKLVGRVASFQEKAGRLLGRNYIQQRNLPLYTNDKKIEKANRFKLADIADQLDELLPPEKRHVKDALKAAYPQLEAQRQLNMNPFQPLQESAHPVDVSGYAFWPKAVLEGVFKLKAGEGFALNFQAKGAVQGDVLRVPLRFIKHGHEFLDTSIMRHMGYSMNLHSRLEAHLDSSPELAKYREMRNALSGEIAGGLSTEQADYYGPEHEIPPHLRHSIKHAGVGKANLVARKCMELANQYQEFAELAEVVAYQDDSLTVSKRNRARVQAFRQDAFRKINETVWGGQYPGGWEAAQKDVTKFLAKSHDAMSMSLGCAGAHLSILKRELVRQSPGPGPAETAIREADEAYSVTRLLMERVPLPVQRNKIGQHAFLKSSGLWQRWHLAVSAKAAGGVAEPLKRLFGFSTNGVVESTSQLLQVEFGAKLQYQNARTQINPCRNGEYFQLEFAAGGGPLTGWMIQEAANRAFSKFYKDKKVPKLEVIPESVLHQANGVTMTNSQSAKFVLKWRMSPDGSEFKRQFVRAVEIRGAGLDLSVSKVINASLRHTDRVENVVRQINGSDLGNLLMRFSALKSLRAKAVDDNGLKELFMQRPEARMEWFGDVDTIMQTLADYDEWEGHQRGTREVLKWKADNNEFFRYGKEPFKTIGKTAQEIAYYRPGQVLEGFVPAAAAVKVPGLDDEHRSLEAIRAELEAKTVDERAELFFTTYLSLFKRFEAIMAETSAKNDGAIIHASTDKLHYGLKTEIAVEQKRVKVRGATKQGAASKGKEKKEGGHSLESSRFEDDRDNQNWEALAPDPPTTAPSERVSGSGVIESD